MTVVTAVTGAAVDVVAVVVEAAAVASAVTVTAGPALRKNYCFYPDALI